MSPAKPPRARKSNASKPQSQVKRNLIGLVALLIFGGVAYAEWSAKTGYNNAVTTLDAKMKDQQNGFLAQADAESILGTSVGPGQGVEIEGKPYQKLQYQWKGLVNTYRLTAFYTKETKPHLHHYVTDGAEFKPEAGSSEPPASEANTSSN